MAIMIAGPWAVSERGDINELMGLKELQLKETRSRY